MQVRAPIARLRSCPAPQPRLDAALAEWRASPAMQAVSAALADYGAGAPLALVPVLARLIADHAAASALAQGLIAPVMAALRAEPLAQLPLGHSAAPGIARIRLAQSGRASLTLAAYAKREYRRPASVLFEDAEAHELILAGAGRALRHRLTDEGLETIALACPPGTQLSHGGTQDARQFVAVERPLLVLQLLREAAAPAPSREIALAGGALLKIISGSKRSSQQMMALGVLGALDHRPALAAMARLALEKSAGRDLRWESLRQVLGMDARRGLALLEELAGRDDDALAVPAAALRQRLIAAQPELARLEPA